MTSDSYIAFSSKLVLTVLAIWSKEIDGNIWWLTSSHSWWGSHNFQLQRYWHNLLVQGLISKYAVMLNFTFLSPILRITKFKPSWCIVYPRWRSHYLCQRRLPHIYVELCKPTCPTHKPREERVVIWTLLLQRRVHCNSVERLAIKELYFTSLQHSFVTAGSRRRLLRHTGQHVTQPYWRVPGRW